MARDAAGELLRDWRRRRRLSQLDLALDAGVSTRHLSFLETGRSTPSASMVARLADRLDVPLRDRNRILLAAGHAPVHPEHALDEPELAPVRAALDAILAGHEPYPALVVDRQWEVVAMNDACGVLLAGVSPALLAPPVNALRLTLHPEGIAPRIVNLGEWRAHLLHDLDAQVAATGDETLQALRDELAGYPGPDGEPAPHDVFIPLRLATPDGELRFLSTRTTFATATDVTLSELAVEAFLPADAATAAALATPSAAARTRP
jgi:transcriptional regulator with XRE-family HTH domain